VALVQELGVGLPAGHLHVWGGPTGAGKTAFLLALLHGAAAQGRRVLYASYDLPPETLALRLLAMTADVDARALAAGLLEPAAAARAARARQVLERAPFHLLAARGLSVASLEDRLVRMPFRAEVLAVDYLQAVVREVNTDPGRALRDLSAVATRLHVAVVCAMRSADAALEAPAALDGLSVESADRVGWIAPADGPGARRAEILRSRYGARRVLPLTLDLSNGALHSG
jgi:replicative DNA helicase